MIKIKNGKLIISSKTPEMIFLAIYSFFAFSKWSMFICSNIIGFSFNIYEILLIPFLFFYRSNIHSFIIHLQRDRTLSKLLIIVGTALFFMILGCIVNPNSLIQHISTYRTVYYYIFIAFYFSKITSIDLNKLHTISMFSVIGDFVYILSIGKNESQVLINPVTICITIMIPIINNRIFFSMICSAFCLIASLRSAYRFSIIISLLSIAFSVISMLIKKRNKKSIILASFIALVFYAIITYFEIIVEKLTSIFSMSKWSVTRVTGRLTNLFDRDFGYGDINRLNSFRNYPNYLSDSFIPRGLYRGAVGEIGWYTDVPIMYLLDAFGTIITIVILILFLSHAIKIIHYFLVYKNAMLAFLSAMIPIYVFMFLVNGTFLYWHYIVVFSSMIVGLTYNNNIKSKEFYLC